MPGITHVFNYALPKVPEDYVHRIGRTGRAGRNGVAVSLVNHAEGMHVNRIERFTKQPIPVDVVEGYEPKNSAAPARAGRKPGGWRPGDNRSGPPRAGSGNGGGRSFGAGKPGNGPRKEGSGGYKGSAARPDGARRSYGDR